MQRCCTKLRSLTLLKSNPHFPSSASSRRLLHSYSFLRQNLAPSSLPPLCKTQTLNFSALSIFNNASFTTHFPPFSPPSSFCLVQVRNVSSRDRRKKRKPQSPVVSKVKKIKMKFYSSFKSRFRPMNDGNIRRWREGKRHNAHLKSKESKRRLRQPATVPPAYAKVMKKLSFCA